MTIALINAADNQPNPIMMFQGIFFRSGAGGAGVFIFSGIIVPEVYQTHGRAALSATFLPLRQHTRSGLPQPVPCSNRHQ